MKKKEENNKDMRLELLEIIRLNIVLRSFRYSHRAWGMLKRQKMKFIFRII